MNKSSGHSEPVISYHSWQPKIDIKMKKSNGHTDDCRCSSCYDLVLKEAMLLTVLVGDLERVVERQTSEIDRLLNRLAEAENNYFRELTLRQGAQFEAKRANEDANEAESHCAGLAAALEELSTTGCGLVHDGTECCISDAGIRSIADDALKDAAPILARVKAEAKAEAFEEDASYHEEMAKDARSLDRREAASAHEVAQEISTLRAAALRKEGL